MNNFSNLEVSQHLKDNLKKMGYEIPTEIQIKAIPKMLQGKDILASAQTGTGKTAAFLIPIIERLTTNKDSQALILAPTRELAMQIRTVVMEMTTNMKWIRSVLLIGGESIQKQLVVLKKITPRIIVGTPGRINDHLDRNSISLANVEVVVLDETDRMLDMGFEVQINAIFQDLPKDKQVALFSATLPKVIHEIAAKYLNNQERITAGETNKVAPKIQQEILETENKINTLLEVLNNTSDTVIIFVKTKVFADNLKKILKSKKYNAEAIHGGLKQFFRTSMIKAYREQKFKILIATDVASRGLDVPHINLVINYDLPENPEDFVHRIGRTGRAEQTGKAISLVSKEDNKKLYNIKKFIGEIKEKPKSFKAKSYKAKNPSDFSFKGKKKYSKNEAFIGKRNEKSNNRSFARS